MIRIIKTILSVISLQDGEAEGSTADADNGVVHAGQDKGEALGGISALSASAGTSRGGNSGARGGGDDRDAGQLAKVGRAKRINIGKVERERVAVVAGLERNRDSVVEGVDKGEVVNRHVGETGGVLVEERDGVKGINRVVGGKVDTARRGHRRSAGLVRPLAGNGGVAGSEGNY